MPKGTSKSTDPNVMAHHTLEVITSDESKPQLRRSLISEVMAEMGRKGRKERRESATQNDDRREAQPDCAQGCGMGMRRFTRLTNGFSKKLENLRHAVAIHYMHYNFCRVHKTLRVTPAMEAGLTDHVWSLEELVGLLEPKTTKVAA